MVPFWLGPRLFLCALRDPPFEGAAGMAGRSRVEGAFWKCATSRFEEEPIPGSRRPMARIFRVAHTSMTPALGFVFLGSEAAATPKAGTR